MESTVQDPTHRRKVRTRLVILVVISLLILLNIFAIYYQDFNPTYAIANNIVVYAVVNINVILLMILVLLVLRNLVKLYFERKGKVVGAKFRTKLVIAFVGLALVPSILLFIVASGLINRSIQGWFDGQVERALGQSQEVVERFYRQAEGQALSYAQLLARELDPADLKSPEGSLRLKGILDERRQELQAESIQVFTIDQREAVGSSGNNAPAEALRPELNSDLVAQLLAGQVVTQTRTTPQGDTVFAFAALASGEGKDRNLGILAVALFLPESLTTKMQSVSAGYREYKQLELLRNPITASYMISYLLITLLIVFSAIWIGFYLARGITDPIQSLVEGTRAVAEGNLDIRVEKRADDEIGLLVDAYNAMTQDLKRSKEEIERAQEGLRHTNVELEGRRAYMETVLENIATGVVSLDRQGRVTTVNQSAGRILGIAAKQLPGRSYREAFDPTIVLPVRDLLKKMWQGGREYIEGQIRVMVNGRSLTLLVGMSLLRDHQGRGLGMVLVFENLTELIKAQKVAAWQEVAQGIAHEIKNPLTPIRLSAERLRKKYDENSVDLRAIVEECTNTIVKQVKGLMELVNEFSRFARMPEAHPRPCPLHAIINDSMALYRSHPSDIQIETDFDQRVDQVEVDEEQMKRVFINLIENAIEAMENRGRIQIRTRRDDANGLIRIEVSDDGRGIPLEDRDRLFLPYFTTKGRGTGLGLAIVHRIVAEHHGAIEVKENLPKGTTFVIQLPANGHLLEIVPAERTKAI